MSNGDLRSIPSSDTTAMALWVWYSMSLVLSFLRPEMISRMASNVKMPRRFEVVIVL